MEDKLPPGTFSGRAIFITAFSFAIIFIIAVFITAFSIQRGSQSCAYNLIYIPCAQLVLEHSGYMTRRNIIFLLVLFSVKLDYSLRHTGCQYIYTAIQDFLPSCISQGSHHPFCSGLFSWFVYYSWRKVCFFRHPHLTQMSFHGVHLVPLTA